MSMISRSKNVSQSDPAAEQVGAKKDLAQGTGAELPKSFAATTEAQLSRSIPSSGAVTDGNESSVHLNAARSKASASAASAWPKKVSKQDTVLELLSQTEGATIDELMDATAWQAHSVRGFLSGTVRKKLKLHLASDVVGNGIRRYRVVSPVKAGSSGEAGDQQAADGSAHTQGA